MNETNSRYFSVENEELIQEIQFIGSSKLFKHLVEKKMLVSFSKKGFAL